MKKQLYRVAAASVLGLSLTSGIVAADTGNIHTTGPHSRNTITSRHTNRVHVRNDNNVTVRNTNDQTGYTGDVQNDNYTSADVYVDNSASTANVSASVSDGSGGHGGSASISNTGPNSDNRVESTVTNEMTVNNDNRINVQNTNRQTGVTGDATVSGNTTGGNATSGSVYNTNSSSFSISVTN